MYIMSLDGEPIFIWSNSNDETKFSPDYIFRTAILRLVQNSHHSVTSIKYQNIEHLIIATKRQIIVIGIEIDSVHVGFILLQLKKIISQLSFEDEIFIPNGSLSQIRTSCIDIISDFIQRAEQEIFEEVSFQFDGFSISSELQA